MHTGIIAIAAAMLSSPLAGAGVVKWTYVPDEQHPRESPWRLIVSDDGTLTSQTVTWRVRAERTIPLIRSAGSITLTFPDGGSVTIREEDDRLVLYDDLAKHEVTFRVRPDMDSHFDDALPMPRTRSQAIATLRQLLSNEDLKKIEAMDDGEIASLNMFTFGMTVRSAFCLTARDSPLRGDLGGGHYEDASWELLKSLRDELKKEEPIKAVDPTPGSAPRTSGGSSAG